MPGVAEFEAHGLYDPRSEKAAESLELLEYLVGVGATLDDLIAYRDVLPGLASVVGLRGGRALTTSEAAELSGMIEEKLRIVVRAAGFPDAAPDDRVLSERFVELAAAVDAAEAVIGEDAMLQLVRVMGSAITPWCPGCEPGSPPAT